MTGVELKNKIQEFGIKKADIAARLSVSPQSISSWFTYKKVSTGILEDLCRLYEKKINDFYKGTPYAIIDEVELMKVENDNKNNSTTSIEKLYTELAKIRAEMGEMETKYQTQLEQKDKTISLLLQEISKLHDHIIGVSAGKKMASR